MIGENNPAYKHGYRNHPLYQTWIDMRGRCNRITHKYYRDYGGRGITVCSEWNIDAKSFIEWSLKNGWENGLQIDRIDNDKGYYPDNCRFVTNEINVKNTRLLFKNNKTGFRGVHFNNKEKKYRAQVSVKGKIIYLGMFNDPEYAAVNRDWYVIKNKLALPLNFPELLELPV